MVSSHCTFPALTFRVLSSSYYSLLPRYCWISEKSSMGVFVYFGQTDGGHVAWHLMRAVFISFEADGVGDGCIDLWNGVKSVGNGNIADESLFLFDDDDLIAQEMMQLLQIGLAFWHFVEMGLAIFFLLWSSVGNCYSVHWWLSFDWWIGRSEQGEVFFLIYLAYLHQ